MPSTKHLTPLRTGLLSLFLAALLTGCGTTEYVTIVERELPPAHLLQDCPAPAAIRPETNADIIRHLHDWRTALRACNTDKEALRAWAEE